MLRWTSLICLAVAAMATAFANDTALIGYGGSVVRMSGTHSQIRMYDESVRLELAKDSYKTSCVFYFMNDGRATSVLMGFPERYSYYDPLEGAPKEVQTGEIRDFSTSIDGKPVPAKRQKVKYKGGDFVAYWTKSVTFSAHQTRRIIVEFRSPYGSSVSGKVAAYDFTGGNWRGKLGSTDMIVSELPGAPHLPFAYLDGHRVTMRLRLGGAQHDWHQWKAEGRFIISEGKR